MDACSDKPFKLETDNDVSSLLAFFGQVRDRLLYLLSDVRERIAHQHCSLQMSYKRIGLYDACMILYQRKWYALYSASAFRPFPLLRNLFEFYLHIYQMYLFRRCHCILSLIIVTTLRPLLLLSLRKVSLSEKIDAWLLDLQGPNKEWIGRYIIIYHEIMLYLIWI